MSDELKKFLKRELDELKDNKFRMAAIVALLVVAIIFWEIDDSSRGEEISLNSSTVDAPTVTKDLPVKPLPVMKTVDGVTPVIGANADALIVADPFAGENKPKPPPPIKTVAPVPSIPKPIITPPKPQEKIILVGTAVSGDNKTAMFLRGKDTIFLTVGDEINGRKISDITSDGVIFSDGETLTIN